MILLIDKSNDVFEFDNDVMQEYESSYISILPYSN